ncbi:MAG TPA: hypothetical protein VIV14_08045 [Gammaproteobacteria bacterium]
MLRPAALLAVLWAAVALCGCSPSVQQLSDSGFGAYEASLTISEDRAAVAWYDNRDGNAEIYARIVDAAGQGIGPEHRLTNDPESSFEADIVVAGEGYAVAWYDVDEAGMRQARLGYFDNDFERRWDVALSPPARDGRIPVLRSFEDRLFCAWLETRADGVVEVRAGWWDFEGRAISGSLVPGPAGATTWNLNAAVDYDGNVYLVYDAAVDTQAEEIFVARVDHGASEFWRISLDDDFASRYPDIAINTGRVALAWFDERDGNEEVYLYAGLLDGVAAEIDASARRITTTPGESIGAYVDWSGDRIGLAWNDDSEGQHEIYFQAFDASGDSLGAAVRVTRNDTDSMIPSIRASGDGFMLAWNEVAPDPRGIHGADTRSEIVATVVP